MVWLPTLVWADRGFQLSTLTIPSRTYGIANEPCVSPGVGDITVSTAADLNTQGELAANVGKNIFLNAGTYTLTSTLTLVDGITLRPNNCAVVIINGRTQVCNGQTLAGLTFTRTFAGTSNQGAIDFPGGTCTGATVRNNRIEHSGTHGLSYIQGTIVDFLGQGNHFMAMPLTGTALPRWSVRAGSGTGSLPVTFQNVRMVRNRYDADPSLPADGEGAIGSSNTNVWGGDITFREEYFSTNVGNEYLDIKGAAIADSRLTLEDSFLNGPGFITPENDPCIIIQNGTGVTGNYTATIRRNVFDRCDGKALIYFLSGGTENNDQVELLFQHNLMVATSTARIHLGLYRNQATIENNTIISGELEIGNATNPNPHTLVVRNNIVSGSTFDFESAGSIDTCENNLFFGTTGTPTCTNTLTSNPVFVNASSDWRLMTTSPAIDSGTNGADRGAYVFVSLVEPAPCARENLFNDEVFELPNQLYGPIREPCWTTGGTVLSTTDAWQTALQSAAPGALFRLNAGTYTPTGPLALPSGTSGNLITIVPNNCAAVTLAGQTTLQSYTTVAGLTAQYNVGSASTAGTFYLSAEGGTTAATLRNNAISSTGAHPISIRNGAQTDLRIEGNDIRAGTSTFARYDIRVDALGHRARVRLNRFRAALAAPSNGDDTIRLVGGWGGDWLFGLNWFESNDLGNYVEIDDTGLNGSRLTLAGNYINGPGLLSGSSCIVTGNVAGGTNSYQVVLENNYATGCTQTVRHLIGSGETGTLDQVGLVMRQNIIEQADTSQDVVEIDRNLATLSRNTIIRGELRFSDAANPNPSGIVLSENIFDDSVFTAGSSVDVCSRNLFYSVTGAPSCLDSLTTDPLFVDVASDWHLQTASPARGAGAFGRNLGVYP